MEKNSFASRVVHMEKHEHGGSKEAADQEAKRSIHIDRRATKPFFELSRRRAHAGADFYCIFLFRAIFFFDFLFRAISFMLSRLATSFRRC